MKSRFGFLFAATLAAQALITPPLVTQALGANVKRFMESCPGNRLCPYFLADVAPPKGWKISEGFGRQNKVVAFFPNKAKLGPADPLIYVRTSFNGDGRTLEQQAENSNAHWRDMVKDAKIERLANIPRGEGKGHWHVYRYTNPSRKMQAHEMLAFGEHAEKGDQKFFYMVTISADNVEAVEKSIPAWKDILGRL